MRLHPVNDVLARLVQVLPLLLLGIPAAAVAVCAPLITFYAILLHADVPWTYGPLRYVIASPALHRWHHTLEDEGLVAAAFKPAPSAAPCALPPRI